MKKDYSAVHAALCCVVIEGFNYTEETASKIFPYVYDIVQGTVKLLNEENLIPIAYEVCRIDVWHWADKGGNFGEILRICFKIFKDIFYHHERYQAHLETRQDFFSQIAKKIIEIPIPQPTKEDEK